MDRPSFLTKSITIRGLDGNDIRVSETAERKEVVISIQNNGSDFRISTARLNADQFKALCQSQYDLDIKGETTTQKEKEAM